MKKHKTIRLKEEIIEKIKIYAQENGMSFSQVIETCVLKQLNISTYNENLKKAVKNKNILNIRVSDFIISNLLAIAQKKNITLSQESRFRLSASLDNPCFDTIEINELNKLRINLNQLGNLIKLALNNNQIIKDEKVLELTQEINLIKDALKKIIQDSSERIM